MPVVTFSIFKTWAVQKQQQQQPSICLETHTNIISRTKKRTKTNKACSSLRLQALTGVMWGVRLYSLLLHASSHKRVILRGVSTILAFSFNWNLQLVAASRIYYITRSQVTLRFSIYSLKLKLEKYHPPFRCFCSYSLSLHFIYSVCSFKLNKNHCMTKHEM